MFMVWSRVPISDFNFYPYGKIIAATPSMGQFILPLWIFRVTFVIGQESRKGFVSSSIFYYPSITVLIPHCHISRSCTISLDTGRFILPYSDSSVPLNLQFVIFLYLLPISTYHLLSFQDNINIVTATKPSHDRPLRMIVFNSHVPLW